MPILDEESGVIDVENIKKAVEEDFSDQDCD